MKDAKKKKAISRKPVGDAAARKFGRFDYQKYFANDLEARIRHGRFVSVKQLAETLAYLVDYPLSKTIIDYITTRLRCKVPDRKAGEEAFYDLAWMMCVGIPRYEEVHTELKVAKRSQKLPKQRNTEGGATLRQRALDLAFGPLMKAENSQGATWPPRRKPPRSLLLLSRRWAEEQEISPARLC